MRAPILITALLSTTLAACGADPEVDPIEPHAVALSGEAIEQVNFNGLTADVEVLVGDAPALLIVPHATGTLPPVSEAEGTLALDACDGCAQFIRLTVTPDTAVTIADHRGLVDVFDLDGPLDLTVTDGDACLTGVAGPTTVTLEAGDLTGNGLWASHFTADVAGGVHAVWTRPPSALSLTAEADVDAVFATYFYSVDITAEGAVDLGTLVPVPESPHHLSIDAGGDVHVTFGPAQGTTPPRR